MQFVQLKRRDFLTLLGSGAIASLLNGWPALGQTAVRPHVGYLTPVPLPFDDEFRRGLRDLGYVDGKNVSVVAPFADGKDENLSRLAKELANIPVDVIVATNSTATGDATTRR